MTDDGANITELPVKFKNPTPEGRTFLKPVEVGDYTRCRHSKFIVDESKDCVECADCGERLSPMWVLSQLVNSDRRFHEAHKRYHDEMKRLSQRKMTKCDNCGHMTRISRR